jgi:hypothetical protein
MVGGLNKKGIPVTPLFKYYEELHYVGAGKRGEKVYGQRLGQAETLIRRDDCERLVTMFRKSLEQATEFFRSHDFSGQDLYPRRADLEAEPGLGNTDQLAQTLAQSRKKPWQVLGDDSLSFYYLDRELVSTRALKTQFIDGRSSKAGPRLDLLLANAKSRRPIVGEVKVTGRGPDKDPFFALVQALTSAAYLLPATQMDRLRRDTHDFEGRIAEGQRKLDIYLLIAGEPPRSPIWFDLRDCAERVAAAIAPQIQDQIETIAALDLGWFETRPKSSRLRITKRFAFPQTAGTSGKLGKGPGLR